MMNFFHYVVNFIFAVSSDNLETPNFYCGENSSTYMTVPRAINLIPEKNHWYSSHFENKPWDVWVDLVYTTLHVQKRQLRSVVACFVHSFPEWFSPDGTSNSDRSRVKQHARVTTWSDRSSYGIMTTKREKSFKENAYSPIIPRISRALLPKTPFEFSQRHYNGLLSSV